MAKYFTKDGDDLKEVDAFSQEEVDDIVTKRLDRERSKYADYEDLKTKASKVDEIKSDFEKQLEAANKGKSELEKKLGEAQLETSKIKLINEFKLSDDLAEFVTGPDEAEMRKRAEKLAKSVKTPKGVDINKGEKPEKKDKGTSAEIARSLFAKKNSDD